MNPRSVLAPVLTSALLVVLVAVGASPAAHPEGRARTYDLLASAHPSQARPTVSETAYDVAWARGQSIGADTAALTSTTCDGCAGESTSLQVAYVPRSRRADLDNVATAWAQQCSGCTGTALSVQVVVLAGRPTVAPNNRALSLTAGCEGCRTSALAFQVVLVADRMGPLSADELASLRAWFDEQAAALRASVAAPPVDPPTHPPTGTPTATPTPTDTPSPSTTPTPLTPTQAATTLPPPDLDSANDRSRPTGRTLRRDAATALDSLEELLSSALPAEVVAADVEVSR